MKLHVAGAVGGDGWRSQLRGVGGMVLVLVGVRVMLTAVTAAYGEGCYDGGLAQIELCKEAGHFDEPSRATESEPRDGTGDAAGEG